MSTRKPALASDENDHLVYLIEVRDSVEHGRYMRVVTLDAHPMPLADKVDVYKDIEWFGWLAALDIAGEAADDRGEPMFKATVFENGDCSMYTNKRVVTQAQYSWITDVIAGAVNHDPDSMEEEPDEPKFIN